MFRASCLFLLGFRIGCDVTRGEQGGGSDLFAEDFVLLANKIGNSDALCINKALDVCGTTLA